jgi:hypothetical protein
VDICRLLLRESTWPDQEAMLSRALDRFSANAWAMVGGEAVSTPIYRLFMHNPAFDTGPAFDANTSETELSFGWLRKCEPIRGLVIIVACRPPQLSRLSFGQRWELVAHSCASTSSLLVRVEDLLGFLDLRKDDTVLASPRSSDGTTVLHLAAKTIRGYFGMPSAWHEWLELATLPVENGTDVHTSSRHRYW